MKRAHAAASIALAAGLAGGCSDEEPAKQKTFSGPEREVVAVVEAFERATAEKDFREICSRLFTAEVRKQAGGEDCEQVLRRSAEGVKDPRLTVERVEVSGDSATARVVTTARGQKRVSEELRLVRQGGSFRLSVLGR